MALQRSLILSVLLLGGAAAQGVSQCRPEFNGLLANDPHGDPQAFLRCQGPSGAWMRQLCPGELVFDFVNQQCATVERKTRGEPNALNIAILNNSCARGESCIGGTICDPMQKKCLCPAGSTPVLETLSCETGKIPGMLPQQAINFLSQKPSQETINGVASLFPNPAVQKFIESFFKPNAAAINGGKGGEEFKPNSNYVFQSFMSTTPVPPTKLLVVPPGSTCRDGEICAGGSVCTAPFGMCLCPGDKEAHNGECINPVKPATAPSTMAPIPTLPYTTAPPKPVAPIQVGLGAQCVEPAVICLDDGAACIAGRCACISPLIQHEGRCIMAPTRKEVGPGDPCDEGEVCTRGSVCDAVIPVCVCPPSTDLVGGSCAPKLVPIAPVPVVPVQRPIPIGPVPNAVPVYWTTPSTTTTSTTMTTPFTTTTSTTTQPPTTTTRPVPVTAAPPLPVQTVNYKNIPMKPVDVRTTSYRPPTTTGGKPSNPIKIQLGGSKQSGVGSTCTLNTDCMIGAYCNGNTAPAATCQCLSTHVAVDGRCEKVIYPGQTGCMADDQCSAAYTGSTCIDRVCVCPAGSRAIEQTCVPLVSPSGGECGQYAVAAPAPDEPSALPSCPKKEACLKGVCRALDNLPCKTAEDCPAKFHCNGGECEPKNRSKRDVLALGHYCDPSSPGPKCGDDAICANGLCTCRMAGGCTGGARRRQPLEACEEGNECTGGAECREGSCRCAEEAQLRDGQCHHIGGAYKNVGAPCSPPSDRCSGGSLCIGGICACTDGSSDSSGRCVQSIGGRCSSGQTCGGGAACDFGICRCAAGTAANTAGVCAPDTARPGASCALGQRCSDGSACRFGVCMCLHGTWLLEGRCVAKMSVVEIKGAQTKRTKKTPAPGEVCTNSEPCIGGAVCTGGYCACPNTSDMILGGICVPLPVTTPSTIRRAAPTQPCPGATQCLGGSTCARGVCSCPPGYIVDPTGVCTPGLHLTFRSHPQLPQSVKSEPGSKCTVTLQCPARTECLRGVCRCPQGETIFEGSCRKAVKPVAPRGPCNPKTGHDCIGEARCIYGACACTLGLVATEKECADPGTLRKVLPGGTCGDDSFCLGSSSCIHGLCKCSEGSVLDPTGICAKSYPVVSTPRLNLESLVPSSSRLSIEMGNREALRSLVKQHYQLPRLGEACEHICEGGAACLNSLCSCSGETVEEEGRCVDRPTSFSAFPEPIFDAPIEEDARLEVTLFGHACSSPSDCPSNSFCFEALCRCMHGYRAHAGKCDAVIGIGGNCLATSQCAHHSVCTDGKCECTGGVAPAPGGKCPSPRLARPGDDCSRGQICAFNSYCGLASGVCECPGGMSTSEGECQQSTVEQGEACVTSRNCHKFSFCDNGYCICKTGYALVNGFCIPLAGTSPQYHLAVNTPDGAVNDVPGMPPNRNGGPDAPMVMKMASYPVNSPSFNVPDLKSVFIPPQGPLQHVVEPRPNIITPGQAFNAFPQFAPVPQTTTTMAPSWTTSAPPPQFTFPRPSFGSYPSATPSYVPNLPTPSPFPFRYPGSSFGSFPSATPLSNGAMFSNVVFTPTTPAPFHFQFPQPSFGSFPSVTTREVGAAFPKSSYPQPTPDLATLFPNGIPQGFNPDPAPLPSPPSEAQSIAQGKVAMPGEFCGGGEVCIAGAVCFRQFCRCPKGAYAENGVCTTKKRSIPATTPETLFVADASPTTAWEEFEPPALEPVKESDDDEEDLEGAGAPRQFSAPLEACAIGEFCTGGSECAGLKGYGKICQCPAGLLLAEEECQTKPIGKKSAGIHDSCGEDTICIGGSSCSTNSTCYCPDGTSERLGICLKLGAPGDGCEDGEVCGSGAVCSPTARSCVCPPGTKAVGGRCMRALKASKALSDFVDAGEPCDEERTCGAGSTCTEEGVCGCIYGGTVLYERQCVPEELLRDFGAQCDDLSICKEGSICLEGSCSCPPDTIEIERRCVAIPKNIARAPRRKFKDQCSLDRYCPDKYSCREGACVCDSNPIECLGEILMNADTEDTKQPPGSFCTLTEDCTTGGICLDSRCVCGFDHDVDVEHGVCKKIVRPSGAGTPCGFSGDCLPSLQCIEGSCTCVNWLVPCDKSTVNEPVTSPPGGSCSEARTCTGGAICREGWCVCPDSTMIVQKGVCVAAAAKATTKTLSSLASSPMNLNAGRKAVPGGSCNKPYESCMNGEECCGGSYCNDFKFCACPTDKPLLIDGECSPKRVAVAGDICSDERTTSCTPGTSCQNGICTCPPGAVAVSGQCVSLPAPSSMASVATVATESTTTANPSIRPLAGPLKNCENGEICTGGSFCDAETGICLCPEGQAAFGDRCAVAPAPPTAAPGPLPQLPMAMETTPARPLVPVITPAPAVSFEPIMTTTTSPETLAPATTKAQMKTLVLPATAPPSCSSDTECGADKICSSGRCVCRAGTVENGAGKCELVHGGRIVRYGGACIAGFDLCSNNAACIDAVCKCVPGQMLTARGQCEDAAASLPVFNSRPVPVPAPAPLPPAPYPQAPQPLAPYPPSPQPAPAPLPSLPFLPEFTFTFPSTTTPRPTTTTSRLQQADDDLKLGDLCWSDTICPSGAACIADKCICLPGYIETAGECQEAVGISIPTLMSSAKAFGEMCTSSGECPITGDCIDGVCGCTRKHIIKDGRCVYEPLIKIGVALPGHSCINGEICTGGSMCDSDNQKCVCAAGHAIKEGRCTSDRQTPFVPPGSRCQDGERCAGGSFCQGGVCICEHDHLDDGGYCRPLSAPNADVQYINGTGLRFKSKIAQRRNRSTPCDPIKCRLPDCFCSKTGRIPPAGLVPSQVPQFVVLTFDDAVNGRTLPDYKRLFEESKYKNPNGCPIKGTFFVSHEWTNYDAVQWIYEGGHEMASNSITHVSLEGSSTQRWLNEMDGQRRIMAKFANAREEEITGMRAPQLAAGGDEMFEMMMRAGFQYDNSLSANGGKDGDPYWPQTMDHRPAFPCNDRPCPSKSFPGIWEVPLNQFYGRFLPQIGAYSRSTMMRAAVGLDATTDDLYNMLLSNLNRSMSTNRAPLVLTLNADYLQLAEEHSGMEALERFLSKIASDHSIYVVTLKQLISWMREPLPLDRLQDSSALKCPLAFGRYPGNSARVQCDKPNKCIYRTPGMGSPEHQFLTCSPCPDAYPWISNPTGSY